ncbi:rhodanese-like domain-containing protein [Bacillus sp. FJAT-29790]|uniref:rhodanese-like domain-containing protein n=1 Tax=Bacillus sp. FJAT-29790 TaxID=1895002 RepID=UPI0020B2A34A|nr:rhodanese-like domain-containing protein [Bacillus sp. FJAT-29790]
MRTINPKELNEKMKANNELYILDVRANEKYEKDHIHDENIQSINIVKTLILGETNNEAISALPKNQEIIVTCTTGNSAGKCAAVLAEKGYNVTVLEGGITAWKEHLE